MNDSDSDAIFDPNAIVTKAPAKPVSTGEKKTDANPARKKAEVPDPELDLSITPLKIDSDVPLPENNAGRKTAFNADRMPFGQLAVGQSFSEVMVNGKSKDGITSKTIMAQVKKTFPEMVFVVRETLDDMGVATSARFWRKK